MKFYLLPNKIYSTLSGIRYNTDSVDFLQTSSINQPSMLKSRFKAHPVVILSPSHPADESIAVLGENLEELFSLPQAFLPCFTKDSCV